MKHYDYIIVGSGLFGATFAYEASKADKSCLVIEKRPHIGGNLYCSRKDGIDIHSYGPHIFHTNDSYIWQYINQLSDFNNFINSPLANYKGEIYNLPFNMNTFVKMWGISKPRQAKEIIEQQRIVPDSGEPLNLEEQALYLVGTDIYERLIKGYTEKQWGRPCKELPAFIIKRIPVRFTFNNNYFNDKYQGIPVNGYNVIISKMLEKCDVEVNTDFNSDKDIFLRMADKVIYTGTIDSFFGYSLGRLEYRSLHFETERLEQENYQGVAVVNYTDKETLYTRIIEHKHFAYGKQPVTYITREYPLEYNGGAEPYYPINDEKNLLTLLKYQELAKKESRILFGGRLAEYRYYDMDQTMISALQMARRELGSGII